MKFLQGPKEDDEGGGVSPLHDLRRVLFSERSEMGFQTSMI